MTTPETNVLVTGGAGFIGSHLVERLLADGYQVTVLDNFRNGRRKNLPAGGVAPRLRVIHGDITDSETCRNACRGVSQVFHLACLGVRHSLHNPVENHQVNALGTLNVLNAAKEAAVGRFLYVSTSEVYGRTTTFPITESTPTWPLTVYGSSKLAGEHYAHSFFECYGLPVTCVRPFNNYGPRSHFEGDAGEALPRFLMRALNGRPPVIFGNGEQTRDFLYVTDCTDALVRIASCDSLVGEVVNLGYGAEISINQLAQSVLSLIGREDLRPVYEAARPADVPRLWADPSKLRMHIDFRPEIDIRAGITHCLQYFQELYRNNVDSMAQMNIRNWEN